MGNRRWVAIATMFALIVVTSRALADHHDPNHGPIIYEENQWGDMSEAEAVLSTPDVLAYALTADCSGDDIGQSCLEGAGRGTCEYAPRHDVSAGGSAVPADAYQVQLIYFQPFPVGGANVDRNHDRPAICSDGSRRESTIGRAMYNNQAWMASRASGHGAQLNGQAFKTLNRTYYHATFAKTYTYRDAMYFRDGDATHNDTYYQTATLTRINATLIAKGFTKPKPKYLIFADVKGNSGCGVAMYNGNKGVIYNRCADGQSMRWGCGDQYDDTTTHELLHTLEQVAPTSPEYSSASNGYHTTQPRDTMHAGPSPTPNSLSGTFSNGATGTVTSWDEGQDSYTYRIKTYKAAYLGSFPNNWGIDRPCSNVS